MSLPKGDVKDIAQNEVTLVYLPAVRTEHTILITQAPENCLGQQEVMGT